MVVKYRRNDGRAAASLVYRLRDENASGCSGLRSSRPKPLSLSTQRTAMNAP